MRELPIPHPDLRESPLHTRRWTLFHRAAPLLRHEGYRNTTIKAVAGVCGVRPSTLYHYFPSKLAMALFPLSTESGLCDAWDRRASRLAHDPRKRLLGFIEFLLDFTPDLALVVTLAGELRGDPRLGAAATEAMTRAPSHFALMIEDLAPGIPPERSADLCQALIKIGGSALPGLAADRDALRRQLYDVARWFITASNAGARARVS